MNNRRRSAPSPLLLPLLIAGLVLLGACRSPVTPDPDPAPGPGGTAGCNAGGTAYGGKVRDIRA